MENLENEWASHEEYLSRGRAAKKYWIRVHEAQVSTNPAAHLPLMDNQVTDKPSLEDKPKSNSQVSLE